MYDLNQIRQFLKIVECGTMLKAADELNMTQPGLSRSMRRLEDELSSKRELDYAERERKESSRAFR